MPWLQHFPYGQTTRSGFYHLKNCVVLWSRTNKLFNSAINIFCCILLVIKGHMFSKCEVYLFKIKVQYLFDIFRMQTMWYRRKAIFWCILGFMFWLMFRKRQFNVTNSAVILNSGPNEVWEYIADFSHMKTLNPTMWVKYYVNKC